MANKILGLLWRNVRVAFGWKFSHCCGQYRYYENAVTGQRTASRGMGGGGCAPPDINWLNRSPDGWVPTPPGRTPLEERIEALAKEMFLVDPINAEWGAPDYWRECDPFFKDSYRAKARLAIRWFDAGQPTQRLPNP